MPPEPYLIGFKHEDNSKGIEPADRRFNCSMPGCLPCKRVYLISSRMSRLSGRVSGSAKQIRIEVPPEPYLIGFKHEDNSKGIEPADRRFNCSMPGCLPCKRVYLISSRMSRLSGRVSGSAKQIRIEVPPKQCLIGFTEALSMSIIQKGY